MPKEKIGTQFQTIKHPIGTRTGLNMISCKQKGSIYRPQCVDCWEAKTKIEKYRYQTRAQCKKENRNG